MQALLVSLTIGSGVLWASSAPLPEGLRYKALKKHVLKVNRSTFKHAERDFRKQKLQLADQSYFQAMKAGDQFYGSWGRATVAQYKGELNAARKHYQTAFETNDSLLTFLRVYADFALNIAQDWDLLEKIIVKHYAYSRSDSALQLLLDGALRFAVKDKALDTIRRLGRRFPKENNLKIYEAVLLRDLGRDAEAVTAAKTAILRTNDPFQLKLMVLILANNGYFLDAARACERLSQIAPKSVHTYLAWGFLESKQGRYANAAENYQRALNRDYSIATMLTLAKLYHYYLEQPAKALYYCKAILQINRQQVEALYLTAEIARKRGDFNTALKYSRRQMELLPGHPQPYYYHGKLLFEQQKYADAIPFLEKAVENNPDIKRYRLILAKAYAGAGLADQAKTIYREYLSEQLKDLWQEEEMLRETPPEPR